MGSGAPRDSAGRRLSARGTGDVPKGGVWVVEAPTKAAVLELMQSDPFYICGLRQGAEVLHWSKALQRQVLV